MESILREIKHGHDLSAWLRMRDGARVPGGNAMFRQNKAVHQRLCELLGLPSGGTRVEVVARVAKYVFWPEQVAQMRAFLREERDARDAAARARLFEERLAALEARPRPHDLYTASVLRIHGR